jgi:thioredoxin reductase (NADPH)
MQRWDLIIIGAGPAGLTAGIYGVRSGLRTLVLEEKLPGGMVATSPWIENYPGFPNGISGEDLAEKMLSQCRRLGAEVKELEGAVELSLGGKEKIVKTENAEYSAGAVIIASGSKHKALGVPGEEKFQGKGVSYCAVCDGYFFKGKRVLVVGGGNCAVLSAIYLANLASDVFLAHRRGSLRAEEAYVKQLEAMKINVLYSTELREIKGGEVVNNAVLFNGKTGRTEELKVDGVFIFVGEAPNSIFAQKAGVKVDEKGYIVTDPLQRTNISGVYTAGDVTSCPVRQVGIAVGQAIIAATEAYGYVKQPYYYKKQQTRKAQA